MKSTTTETPFQSFLDIAIRRLWLLGTIDVIKDSLWLLVGLAVVMAGVHSLITAVPATVLWLPFYLIIAVTGIRIVLCRPKLASAAIEIDRRFAAGALISTASECLQTPVNQRGPAATLVIAQANESASQWRHDVAGTLIARPRLSAIIALVPIFVATFLLLQSGPNPQQQTAGQQAPISTMPVAMDKTESSADPVPRLRAELTALQAPTMEDSTDPATGIRPNPPGNDEDSSDEVIEPSPLALAKLTAENSDSDNGAAGDAAAYKQSESQPAADRQRMQSANFQVQRAGEAQATQRSSHTGYDAGPVDSKYAVTKALPAAPPEKARDRSTLTAAQAAYVSRYLQATGENND